ncbi:hypothetical protein QYF36_001163 [Acer negundo]|nr:hypothetical protein QYF36_001163 [Acer negundo]
MHDSQSLELHSSDRQSRSLLSLSQSLQLARGKGSRGACHPGVVSHFQVYMIHKQKPDLVFMGFRSQSVSQSSPDFAPFVVGPGAQAKAFLIPSSSSLSWGPSPGRQSLPNKEKLSLEAWLAVSGLDAAFHSLFVLLRCYLIRNGTERSRPDSGFIDRVAGQRPKERDQSHSSGSPLVRRLTVIPESDPGAENSIQDRKQLMISVTMT